MINTQYGILNDTITAGQNVNSNTPVKENALNDKETVMASECNRDTFEYSTVETVGTYSPETIGKGANSVNSVDATTSQATTDAQKRLIPELLAAKMAGLTTDSSGSPHINSQSDYNAYVAAWRTIRGDHADLPYEGYCYSQTGYSYGVPNPEQSCDTFAFATALSIMYQRQITPKQIERNSLGEPQRYPSETSGVYVWKASGVNQDAYEINQSREDETYKAIDAQLQLGRPALIHVKGPGSDGRLTQHWATVIGKENGTYHIIDPWDGSRRNLEDMEIYRNNGSEVLDYVILSDKY